MIFCEYLYHRRSFCVKLLAVPYCGIALVHLQRCKGVPVSTSVINSVNNGIDMMNSIDDIGSPDVIVKRTSVAGVVKAAAAVAVAAVVAVAAEAVAVAVVVVAVVEEE